MKSGNLNILEPSGPLQACNGTALPLLYSITTASKGQRNYRLGHTQWNISVFTLLLIIDSQLHRLFLQLSFPLPLISKWRGASSSLLPTIILCAYLIYPLRAACPTNLILAFIIPIIDLFCKELHTT
jgi:hypothetical protein